jgi:ATP-binding cassette subfamily B protein
VIDPNLRRLLRLYVSQPKPVVISIAGAMGVITMAIITPLLIEQAIDGAIGRRRADLLLPLVVALVVMAAIKSAAIWTRKRFAAISAVRTEAQLRARLYEHLQGLDLSYHERTPTGQLMSRASSDLKAVQDLFGIVPISIAMSFFVLGVTVILLIKDFRLAVVALAALPFLGTAGAKLTSRLDPIVWQTQQHLAELTAVAEETITGIRVVKAFGREEHQVGRLKQQAEKIFQRATEAIRVRALLHPLFELFPSLSMAAVLWYGGYRVAAGELSFGEFLAFGLYMTQLAWPIRMFGWLASESQRAATASRRIFEVLDTRALIEDRPGAKPLEISSGHIRFENVRYEAERTILAGIDLDVPPGASLALVGPTGCGKSTILRLMLRFAEPSEGRILVDGVDTSEASLESLRAQIGTVFEDTFLFSDTVERNISFGRPDASLEEIVSAAALAQAHGFISELPDGYQSPIGEQGYTLSGGQRQRIAIARAILMNPRILLLDDATSSVDPVVEAEVRRGLAEAMRGRTTLIVARRPSSAALADRVAYMEAGRILAVGTHSELWERLPAYRETLVGFDRRLVAAGRPTAAEAGDSAPYGAEVD